MFVRCAQILWGHRFENVVTFRKDTAEYEVNYRIFNNTYEIDTPLCSAKQLDEVRAELHLPNGLGRFYGGSIGFNHFKCIVLFLARIVLFLAHLQRDCALLVFYHVSHQQYRSIQAMNPYL